MSFKYKVGDVVIFNPRQTSRYDHKGVVPGTHGIVDDSEQGNLVAINFHPQGFLVCEIWDLDLLERKRALS